MTQTQGRDKEKAGDFNMQTSGARGQVTSVENQSVLGSADSFGGVSPPVNIAHNSRGERTQGGTPEVARRTGCSYLLANLPPCFVAADL